jgi:hypothetical protein
MIELNLSFEQSKKILELGYDFSEVCTFFKEGNVTYIKVNEDIYLPTYAESWNGMIYAGINNGDLPIGAIPIIPKAVLESCCFIKSGMLADYVEPYLCQVFKNFIWSHERHTESTKARFKKVMGIWLT